MLLPPTPVAPVGHHFQQNGPVACRFGGVDPADFRAPEFGRAQRRPGDRAAFWYFEPAPLPRDLDPATVDALSEADAALGQLHGLGRLVRSPELLIGPYVRREAVASSRIEGAEASLSDLLQAEAGGGSRADDDVAEVERYVAATYRGLELVRSLPLSRRLVCELHAVLLDSVRGADRLLGSSGAAPSGSGQQRTAPTRRLRPAATRVRPRPVRGLGALRQRALTPPARAGGADALPVRDHPPVP